MELEGQRWGETRKKEMGKGTRNRKYKTQVLVHQILSKAFVPFQAVMSNGLMDFFLKLLLFIYIYKLLVFLSLKVLCIYYNLLRAGNLLSSDNVNLRRIIILLLHSCR